MKQSEKHYKNITTNTRAVKTIIAVAATIIIAIFIHLATLVTLSPIPTFSLDLTIDSPRHTPRMEGFEIQQENVLLLLLRFFLRACLLRFGPAFPRPPRSPYSRARRLRIRGISRRTAGIGLDIRRQFDFAAQRIGHPGNLRPLRLGFGFRLRLGRRPR